uniref:RING-type domain-containing protein n=1 Tax=Ganoderma boninense TaxID=34458 RepID=A0A5K1K1W4_9APHY|nr:Uncharacterized protein [Ganoderma boninense]
MSPSFPQACCRRPIPLTSIWGHLSDRLQSTFEEKRREFTAQNRVYCAKQSCSRFLAAQQDRSPALRDQPSRKCPAPGCGTITCLRCKNEVKPSTKHRCADSEVDKPALKLARDVGWARCPGCAAMIELNRGCYHMTCRCKTQFCYRCSARWKTCACPQWEEPDPPDPPALPVRPRRRERPPPIRIPARPPTARTPEQIRRDRSLPQVPAPAPTAAAAPRPRQQRTLLTGRQQRRAYRILPLVPDDEPYRLLPFPGDEDEDEDEDGPWRFILLRMESRERRPISGLSFADDLEHADAGVPVAGPSRISRASTHASSSDSRTLRDSLELVRPARLHFAGCAHDEMDRELGAMITLCDICGEVRTVAVSNRFL